jgi:hypothetical protein
MNGSISIWKRVTVLGAQLKCTITPTRFFSASQNESNPFSEPAKIKDYSKERKMSALELQHLNRKGKKLAMITAYDYPSVRFSFFRFEV